MKCESKKGGMKGKEGRKKKGIKRGVKGKRRMCKKKARKERGEK